MSNTIYVNNNRSTQMDARVREAMNASEGISHTQVLQPVADMIGGNINDLIITRGTSEAIALGIEACFNLAPKKGKHLLTNQTEHPAVISACEKLREQGAEIDYLPVDREGRLDLTVFAKTLRPDTQLVCVMAANNETGVLQDVEGLGHLTRERGILFFSDACQVIGKSRFDVNDVQVDAMAFGSHKMYGPPGIGALYVRDAALREKILAHYQPLNDTALLRGFAKAAEVFLAEHWDLSSHLSKLRAYLEHQVLDIPGLRLNGSTRHRLYNTSNICFPPNQQLETLLQQFDFAHNFHNSSKVLEAMGLSPEEIRYSCRFSFGKYNSLDEVKLLVEQILKIYGNTSS